METLNRIISIAICIICIAFITNAQNPAFPNIKDIESYQTEVNGTDVYLQMTVLATEYFDSTAPLGRLDFSGEGMKTSIYNSLNTEEIIEVNSTTCKVYDADFSEYFYMPLFYGWLNKNPLIIGPSALLWYAHDHRSEIKGLGEAIIRSIKCYKYSLNILGPKDNITIYYYIAVDGSTAPEQREGFSKVPIRIEVQGRSSKYTYAKDEWLPYNFINDFTSFKPIVTNSSVFQLPIGIGCQLKKPTRVMPKVPEVFAFKVEVQDLLETKEELTIEIEHQAVWYDRIRMIARFDNFTRQDNISELYDFNTGVTYTNLNGQTCTIKSLKDSYFTAQYGNYIGYFKSPSEVLQLDGNFYYIGQDSIRGVTTDVFESVEVDVEFQGKTLKKLVVTAYYTTDTNDELKGQIPVRLLITGWSTPTQISVQLKYNIFEWQDFIAWTMYAVDISKCFPLKDDKSYFMMQVDATAELVAKMAQPGDMILQEITNQIGKFVNVSDMRIPYLKYSVDFKTMDFFITGMLLNRPPALKQFWLEYTGEVMDVADPYLKIIVEDTNEKCAYACVDENDFACTGFYMCNNVCFLKSDEEPWINAKKMDLGVCENWRRATKESTNQESYLVDVLKKLKESVASKLFTLAISITKNNVTEEVVLPIKNIIFWAWQ